MLGHFSATFRFAKESGGGRSRRHVFASLVVALGATGGWASTAVGAAAPVGTLTVTAQADRLSLPLDQWDTPVLESGDGGQLACGDRLTCVAPFRRVEAGVPNMLVAVTDDGWDTYDTLEVPDEILFSPIDCPTPTACVSAGGRSTDGGRTWTATDLPTSVDRIEALDCASATSCTAVGRSDDPGRTRRIALTSDDQGNSWIATSAMPLSVRSIADVACPTNTTCIATGRSGGASITLRSLDGSATWETIDIASDISRETPGGPNGVEQFSASLQPESLSCPSIQACYVSGALTQVLDGTLDRFGFVRRTLDAGGTWSTRESASDAFPDIECTTVLSCYVAEISGDAASRLTTIDPAWTADGFVVIRSPDLALNRQPNYVDVDCPERDRCYTIGSGLDGDLVVARSLTD